MTAEKILKESYSTKPDIDNPYKLYWSEDVVQAMQEYAKIKCQELLEIVADKARAEDIYPKHVINEYDEVIHFIVDKDSILSAVELDSFIV